MTDNTQINTGTGDFVRDIDRGTAKTQVVQLDAGGQSAESLVSSANPLPIKLGTDATSLNGLPTDDISTQEAQGSDQPFFTSIVGDPNGDFAGVNILEKLVDDSGELKMAVKVVNPPKFDAQGAQMMSDAPAPINLVGAVGQLLYIDTTGYQSLHFASPVTGGMSATLTASTDGVTWINLLGFSASSAAASPLSTTTAGNSCVFPVISRFIRVQIISAGSAVAYLRSIPAPNPAVIMPQNIAQVNGVVAATAGASGVLAIGGTGASGTLGTPLNVGNPVMISGIDSGTPGVIPTGGAATNKGAAASRQLLTDNTGKLRLAEENPVQTIQNTPALQVQDSSQFEGQGRDELLAQILLETRINNALMAELPRKLYSAFQSLQLAPTAQNLFAGLVSSDDPADFRADPTVFNQ